MNGWLMNEFFTSPLRTQTIASLPGLAYEMRISTQLEEVLEYSLTKDRQHLLLFQGVPYVLAKSPLCL